ncbi:hypothetical protein JAAARDRAFT_126251, partial [Jaapia argillacea MUCL 33604]
MLDKYFNHPLQHAEPLLVIGTFMVIVINLLGGVSQSSCNFVLKMLQFLLSVSLGRGQDLDERDKALLLAFPHDIRTVRKHFDLEPETRPYAVCLACKALNPP